MLKSLRFAIVAASASLVAAPALAADSPVVGTWNTEAVTDFGTFRSTLLRPAALPRKANALPFFRQRSWAMVVHSSSPLALRSWMPTSSASGFTSAKPPVARTAISLSCDPFLPVRKRPLVTCIVAGAAQQSASSASIA